MEPMAASSSPALPLVMAPMGNTFTTALLPRALDDVAGDRGAVVHRLGVRHAADGGESARRRGARPALDGLGVLEAGLAQVHVHVDEAGRDDQPGRVEHFGARRRQIRRRRRDAAVLDQHVGDARRCSDAGSITRPFLMTIGMLHPQAPFRAPPCARRCRSPPDSESLSAANPPPRTKARARD